MTMLGIKIKLLYKNHEVCLTPAFFKYHTVQIGKYLTQKNLLINVITQRKLVGIVFDRRQWDFLFKYQAGLGFEKTRFHCPLRSHMSTQKHTLEMSSVHGKRGEAVFLCFLSKWTQDGSLQCCKLHRKVNGVCVTTTFLWTTCRITVFTELH